MSHINSLVAVIPSSFDDNSGYDFLSRGAGIVTHVEDAAIGGTGAQSINVFQFTGSVIILNQWAQITEVTTLTNLTNMYAVLYDGTNTVDLTADGAVLSNAPVGTIFTKDKISSEIYNVTMADQCRMTEVLLDKKSGRPFIITAKGGVDNYIQFKYTTTDNPINFKMDIWFEYVPINGATLTAL